MTDKILVLTTAGSKEEAHKIGRALQLLGLVILPIAISGNVADKLTLQESLMLSGLGMFVFFAGWSMQQGSRGK